MVHVYQRHGQHSRGHYVGSSPKGLISHIHSKDLLHTFKPSPTVMGGILCLRIPSHKQ